MLTLKKIVVAIREEMDMQHINQMDLAHMLKVPFATVNGIFIRKSISLNKLIEVSLCLKFNFIRLIADELDLKLGQSMESLDKETDEQVSVQIDEQSAAELTKLRLRNEFLEDMNNKLLKAIASK